MSTVSGDRLLAPELWDLIFREIDDDNDLLSIATVCRMFVGIASRVALDVFGNGQNILLDETIHLDSRLLRAVDLSAKPVAARAIVATLDPATLHRDLVLLRCVLDSAKDLQKLELDMQCNVFAIPLDYIARAKLLHALTAVLASVAERSSSVVVVSQGPIFTCGADAVRQWNLHCLDAQFSPVPSVERHAAAAAFRQAQRETDDFLGQTQAIVLGGALTSVFRIIGAQRVSIECLPGGTALIVFDAGEFHSLSLATASRAGVDSEVLVTVLAHGVFPAVELLQTCMDLAPTVTSALPAFFERHPSIKRFSGTDWFRYLSPTSPASSLPASTQVFPTFAHPSIEEVVTQVNWSAHSWRSSALAALSTSPRLRTLRYQLPPQLPPPQLALMREDLRIISTMPPGRFLRIELKLDSPCAWSSIPKAAEMWLRCPEILALAALLHPVRKLEMHITTPSAADAAADVEEILPWVRRLPALTSFDLQVTVRNAKTLAAFLKGMETSLEEVEERAVKAEELGEMVRAQLGGVRVVLGFR